jgi:hypothetical protein
MATAFTESKEFLFFIELGVLKLLYACMKCQHTNKHSIYEYLFELIWRVNSDVFYLFLQLGIATILINT